MCSYIKKEASREVSLQELDFDPSICMAAIFYSRPIRKIWPDIIVMLGIIVRAKFLKTTLSNRNVFS